MDVTRIDRWDQDPQDGRYSSGRGLRHPRKPPGDEEDDVVQIHGEDEEEPADGLDLVE
jgi:hypothetical protein